MSANFSKKEGKRASLAWPAYHNMVEWCFKRTAVCHYSVAQVAFPLVLSR